MTAAPINLCIGKSSSSPIKLLLAMSKAPQNSRLKFALRALRHRNYRLFFGGQSLSLMGSWMTQVATSWLVYRLTGSAFILGLVGFSGQVPALLMTPFAGVWVDRWNR